MVVINKLYRTPKQISEACSLIISKRLYTPSKGIIRDMCISYLNGKDKTSVKKIVIAFEEGDPIGCATYEVYRWFDGSERYVNTWVKPSKRRKGVATGMLNQGHFAAYGCYDTGAASRSLYAKFKQANTL